MSNLSPHGGNRYQSPEAISREYDFQQRQPRHSGPARSSNPIRSSNHIRPSNPTKPSNPALNGPPPPRPIHGQYAVNFDNSSQPNPYHRGTTNINRSKSLTRPERQRPRTGMINRNPSQPRHSRIPATNQPNNHSNNQPNNHLNNHLNNQPMSSSLQLQLEQQKQQQQQQQQPIQVEEKEKEKEPRVLTNWWAWIAFLCTCCFPNYIIRVWFGKSNKNMQQAWREKVCIYIYCYIYI